MKIYRYQVKGFGTKSKQRSRIDSSTQRLHKHEYEIDERKELEGKNSRTHMLATPRGSWASRCVYIFFLPTPYTIFDINPAYFDCLLCSPKSKFEWLDTDTFHILNSKNIEGLYKRTVMFVDEF